MKQQTFTRKKFEVDSNHTCLVAISLDFAIYKNENYYLQLLIKECKNIEKKKKNQAYQLGFLEFS